MSYLSHQSSGFCIKHKDFIGRSGYQELALRHRTKADLHCRVQDGAVQVKGADVHPQQLWKKEPLNKHCRSLSTAPALLTRGYGVPWTLPFPLNEGLQVQAMPRRAAHRER